MKTLNRGIRLILFWVFIGTYNVCQKVHFLMLWLMYFCGEISKLFMEWIPHLPDLFLWNLSDLTVHDEVRFLTFTTLWANSADDKLIPFFANSEGPDQLASEEANWSGKTLFAIHYANLYWSTIWIKESDWLTIRNGDGILIYSAWQELINANL